MSQPIQIASNRRASRQGFTLVEVALAMMVIGVGLMAIFGLFTTGLDTDKASLDDTMSAFFAEDVMSAIMASSVTTRWDRLQFITVIPAATDQWLNVSELIVRRSDNWRTNKYVYRHVPQGEQFVEYAVRYKLTVDRYPPAAGLRDQLGYARLDVLPGEFGPTDHVRRFYMEMPNMKPR